MGALTHSSLDRAVVARYFAFLIISQLVIFTLIGVLFSTFSTFSLRNKLILLSDCVKEIIFAIGNRVSFKEIIANFDGSLHSFSLVLSLSLKNNHRSP